jgi:Na+/H+ antiporter NhaD/arsenite permease-like protein
MDQMTLALILFIVMYVFLLRVKSEKRWIVALCAAAVFVLLGILPLEEVPGAIDWNVIMMLTGTMIVVQFFLDSSMPMRMAEMLLRWVPNVKWAVVALSVFSGVISAFVDNVATVLMVAPVGLAVARQLDINPVPVIISIAVSSNLQGAATLVGDTTSILLGTYADMSFNDFFWFQGKPGIAFAVEAGGLMTIPVLLILFRKEKAKVDSNVTTVVSDYVPSWLLVGMIASLIIASQFENKPSWTNGCICMIFALVGLIYTMIHKKSFGVFKEAAGAIDYPTLLLLAGLFIVIAGITKAGVIDAAAVLFVHIGGTSVFKMYSLIVFFSVLLSAFIDNIPYVATMLPVVQGIAELMGIEPYLFYYGLLIGATLGGNLTPVGASANIAGIGILNRAGYEVRTRDFMRIGVPFTLVAVLTGYLVLWLVWA